MRIDPKIEAPLRSALWCVVNEDPEGAGRELEPLDTNGLTHALYYSWFSIGYIVANAYGDSDGNSERIHANLESGSRELASVVVDGVSPWFELGSVDEVTTFIEACATGAMGTSIPEGVNVERLPQLSIIVCGYLLARYRPEDTEWFEYLDQIWNFAEQQPAP